MKAKWFAWAAALLALSAQPLTAQLLGGRVLDKESNEPVKDAVVELLSPEGRSVQRSRSDRDGFFVFELRQPGTFRLRTSRIGYQATTSSEVAVEERQTVQVELKLSTTEVTLDPLTVTARSAPPRSRSLDREGFYDRARSGFGLFLDSSKLDARDAINTSEFFRGLAGVTLAPVGGNKYQISMTRSGRNCPPQVILDGAPVGAGDLDSFVQPRDVDGIEIYRGATEVPGRWMAQRSACGLIVIWTKRGEPNRQ